MPDHEILEQARRIRYDLTALQAKITELMRMAANLPEPDAETRPTCSSCGLPQQGPRSLAEHLYHVHDGPLPAHWQEDDRSTAADPTATLTD